MGVIRKLEEEERDAARARGRSAFVKEDILYEGIGQCPAGIEGEEGEEGEEEWEEGEEEVEGEEGDEGEG